MLGRVARPSRPADIFQPRWEVTAPTGSVQVNRCDWLVTRRVSPHVTPMGNHDASGQVLALQRKEREANKRVDQCLPRCELFGAATKKLSSCALRFANSWNGDRRNLFGYVFRRLADKPTLRRAIA
jgi:hypothetical protein